MATHSPAPKFTTSGVPTLRRKCACGSPAGADGVCAACRKKQLQEPRRMPAGIQTKLAIGASDDPLELEADRAADRIVSTTNASDPQTFQIQRSLTQPAGETDVAPASVDRVLASPGRPLETSLRKDMETRFGFDFSRVRVHTDARAAESARAINAFAYTAGRDIVFDTGQYTPHTHSGRSLLAHELTHVVQQSASGPSAIQRLIRTPYPWQGVIMPASGAHVRSSPDSSNPANILDSLPRGQRVTVTSNSGDWLRVESHYRGPLLTGYIRHTLVDDATAASMEGTVATTMVWRPSGPGSGTDFESWASAPTETPFPAVTAATVMNCWEAVLLSAYRKGAITWNWIHNMYVSVPTANWVSTMSRGPRRTYLIPGPSPMPQRGDIVFFNGIAHVALANGNGSEVYTFWPPPNTPFVAGGTTDQVKVFTIETLVTWWTAHMPPMPVVEFGAPAW